MQSSFKHDLCLEINYSVLCLMWIVVLIVKKNAKHTTLKLSVQIISLYNLHTGINISTRKKKSKNQPLTKYIIHNITILQHELQ